MTNKQNPIVAILAKHALRQPLSEEEQQLLDEWRARSEAHEEYPAQLRDEDWRTEHQQETEQAPSAAMWENISRYIESKKESEAVVVTRNFSRYRVAAAVALFAGAGTLAIILNKRGAAEATTPKTELAQLHVLPRTDDSSNLLRLGDGRVVSLERYRPTELVWMDSSQRIVRTENGIAYEGNSNSSTWNELSVGARARRPLRVDFPGGHRIWLNNSTQLGYTPTLKEGPDPILNGEAVFDIKKDYFFRPLQIRTLKAELLTVLGTFFSVRSFSRERRSKVELYSGKVQVKSHADSLILRPESVALLEEGAAPRVVPASVLKPMPDWIRPRVKSRFFEFERTPMIVALREVADWYQLDLSNPQAIPGTPVTGRLSRDESLENTLRSFEKVEGGRIRLVPRADTLVVDAAPSGTR